MPDLLDQSEIKDALKKLPEWKSDGTVMQRNLEFTSFMEGVDFVNLLADMAEDAGHHPDIDIRYRRISLSLTTHDAGGLTAADLEMAKRIDCLVE